MYAIHSSARYRNSNISKQYPIPADYQIPKILESLGVLKYNEALKHKIDNDEFILSGSKEEVSIRAASIIACNRLAEYNNISPERVDDILFNKFRKKVKNKHHLTVTTNY